MKNKSLIKKFLLGRKIQEFFFKNPNSSSVIVQAKLGEINTMWKVVKEGKSFKVTEVNTVREDFILEVAPAMPSTNKKDTWDPNNPQGTFQRMIKSLGGPNKNGAVQQALMAMPDKELQDYFGVTKQQLKTSQSTNKTKGTTSTEAVSLEEASVEFTNMSRAFTDAMSSLGDHSKLSKALRDLNTGVGKVADPSEKQQVGMMIGALTGAVDASTAGGGKIQVRRAATTTMPTQSLVSSKQISGKSLREDEQKSKKKDDPTVVKKNPEEEQNLDNVSSPDKMKTEDMASVSRTLEGQTIESAELEGTPSGTALILNLAGSKIPVRLEVGTSGKITYYYQGVPYSIERE